MATTITVDGLNADPALQTVTPPADPIINSGTGIINSAVSSIDANKLAVDNAISDAKTKYDQIVANQAKLTGKAGDIASENELAGVNAEKVKMDKYNMDLNDINANISGLANEAKAIPLLVQENNKNVGATDRGVAPQTAGDLRKNSIKALTQASLADIATANINNSTIRYNSAKDKATEAINIKYQPIEQEITNLKDQIALNKLNILDPAEARLLANQEKILNERTRLMTEKKNNEITVNNLKLEALKNYGSKIPASVLSGIEGKTPDQAMTLLAPYLKTNTNEITKLDDGRTVVVDKQTGKIVSTLSGGGVNDPAVPVEVVRTVTSADGKTNPVSGYALQSGDDPYMVAKQNGTDMETLKKLNPDIKDWNNLPVGQVLNLPNKNEAWLTGKTPEQVRAYNSLPDADKASIKQLVNGEALLTDIVKSRGKNTQAQIKDLINKATKIDPTFSINQNKIRFEYQKQWDLDNTKGNVGTKTAINTALGHLADLKEASSALPQGTIKKMNSVKNVLNKEFGDPAVTNFRINLDALATELARVYKGGVPNEGEIKEWQTALAESFSKEQFTGGFNTASKLLTSKITALRFGYKSTMGKEYENTVIDPEKRQALIDAGIDPNSIAKENTGFGTPNIEQDADPLLGGYSIDSTTKNLVGQDFISSFNLK